MKVCYRNSGVLETAQGGVSPDIIVGMVNRRNRTYRGHAARMAKRTENLHGACRCGWKYNTKMYASDIVCKNDDSTEVPLGRVL